tara:strand:+ start:352 stop:525 length:174 start_codon:yes stop_codon:yes gene_type:complete
MKNRNLELLDQIIEKAQIDDLKQKQSAIDKGQGEKAVGESWMVYHLKLLRGLMSEDE